MGRIQPARERGAYVAASAALVLALLFTAGLVYFQYQNLQKEQAADLNLHVERIEREIFRRFTTPMYGLRGLKATYLSNGKLSRTQFRNWMAARDLPAEFPGIRGIGFIERVEREGLDAFIARERADDAPEFTVKSNGSGADLFVIKQIEPLSANYAAVGFDIGQEAFRREAVERAMYGGEAALSMPITLIQDKAQTPGFLLLLPIYKADRDPYTREQRKAAFVGAVYVPIVTAELMAGVKESGRGTLDFSLVEEGAPTGQKEVFNSGIANADRDLFAQRALHVGGRTLTVNFFRAASGVTEALASQLLMLALLGVLSSFMVAMFVWSMVNSRKRALDLAHDMTQELDQLARVVKSTNNAVTIADPQMRIVWVNPAFTKMTGYTLEEAKGRTPGELLGSGKSDPSAIHALEEAVRNGEACRVQVINRSKEGAEYWVETEVQPHRDVEGRLTGYMEIGTDITARMLAEEQARHSAMILRNSIEALDDAFVLYDNQDRLVLLNQKYKEFYPESAAVMEPGRTFEEIIRYGAERGQYQAANGRVEAWIEERMALHRQDHSRMQQTTASGRALRVVERRTPDGYTVGFRVDVTDLVRATEAAQEASLSKSQFLANMSHEIRTPMNAILGMLKLLQHTELTGTQLDYAVKAEGAARSLLGLLNDILDFSKVEAGKMTLDPRAFRMDRLLRDLSVILSANVGQRAIEVLFDIDPQIPKELVGDDMRLMQVLINLGGNAIKFTEAGEVVLRLRLKKRVDALAYIEFSMQDSGIGIAPENQARIFSGFSQAEANTTRRFGGTGLGLAISQRLVDLMQGQLGLQSEVGKGSTFHFEIPLQVVVESAVTDAAAAALPRQGELRTLVVDDNAVARSILQHMIASLGWQVDTASGGAQALAMTETALANGLPYRVIFMDWQMPHMDGWRTAERIRELMVSKGLTPQDAANPLIVMITAHSRDMLAQRNAQEHALLNGFLVKPVTVAMLVDAVQDAQSAEAAALTGTSPVALHVPDTPRRLAGLRLLVVEDNKVNQMVAQGLLTQEGAEITLADNGQLGVDAVANTQPPFDLVLMDLQMPVMDGFDATKAIRQQLGMQSLPIVAMTANAMASDKAACLAAGMNAHVGKPFELDELIRVVLQHVGQSTATPVQQPTAYVEPSSQRPAEAAGDLPVLDAGAAIARMGGDTDLFSQTLRAFSQELRPMLAQAQDALVGNDIAAGQRVLHTLKGLAATMGAMQLSQVAAQLEKNCKAGWDAQTGAPLLAQLGQSMDVLEAEIALAQARFGPAPEHDTARDAARQPDPALAASLQALEQLLLQNDMTALERFAEITRDYGDQWGPFHAPLEEAMASLDFEEAAKICRSAALDL